jgi:hypothetical protein
MAAGEKAPRVDQFRFTIPGGTYQTTLLARAVVLKRDYVFSAAWFVPLADFTSAGGSSRSACVYWSMYAGSDPQTQFIASAPYTSGATAKAFVANPIPVSVSAGVFAVKKNYPAGSILVAGMRDVGGGADYPGGGVIIVDMARA